MSNKPFHPMLCALFNSSILWIEKTVSIENRRKTIEDIAKENGFNLDRTDQSNPFNPALLIAGAYLFFLYQKECETDLSKIDTSDLVVKEGDGLDLARRLRNSIAHGNFTFLNENVVEFMDSNGKNNVVRLQISMGDLGKFINNCLASAYKRRL
jgi:hypothetical protein